MVGLVADELPVAVLREGNAQLAQPKEAARGEGCLGKGVVAIHGPTGEERLGHLPHRVAIAAGQGHLVVRLLVRARVA